MEGKYMAEPTSSAAAAGVAGWKLLGGMAAFGGIGAGLASVVVMCLTHPRTREEWAVGLTCTVVGSMGGGSAVIMHYQLQEWAKEPVGLVAMLGVAFACGLPAWAVVRWMFAYINKRRDADLLDVANDLKGLKP